MRHARVILLLAIMLGLWSLSLAGHAQWREVDPQTVIDDAHYTLQQMLRHPEYAPLREDLRTARGVLIFPRVLRGGFFVGGSGGLGVLSVWDQERRDFSPVAFYSIGAVSLGLQFGGEVAEVIMVAKTQQAVDALFVSAFRLGGDASVAAGPVGVGRRASVNADFVSYARSQGAFLGLSLEGLMLRVRDDFNTAYYGLELRPVQILENRLVDDPGTLALRQTLLGLRQADPAVDEHIVLPPDSQLTPEPEPAVDFAAPPLPDRPASTAPQPTPATQQPEPPPGIPLEAADPQSTPEQGTGGLTIEEFHFERP